MQKLIAAIEAEMMKQPELATERMHNAALDKAICLIRAHEREPVGDDALESAIISWIHGNDLSAAVTPVHIAGLIKNIKALRPQQQPDNALKHLGDVLYMLSDLHSDDRTRAYVEALEFYNKAVPDNQIAPSGIGNIRLRTEYANPQQPESGSVVERVAKAIFFAARGEWSITPHHANEETRKLAESWWMNPPNKEYAQDKEIAFMEAKAALAAMQGEHPTDSKE